MIGIVNHEIKHHTENFNDFVKKAYGDWSMIQVPILLEGDSIQSFFERMVIILESVDANKINQLNEEIRERYESISIEYINKLHSLLIRFIK